MAQPYLGEIRLFAGTFAPQGFAFCNGALLPIAQNQALYALLGTMYGGDGVTTFGLPDLRGRVPVSYGQGPGLSNYALGQAYGTEAVTVTSASMPAHQHPFNAVNATASSLAPTPTGTMSVAASPSGTYMYAQQSGATLVQLATTDVSAAGGNQPHTNIMPVLAINYIIALEGIFPPHS